MGYREISERASALFHGNEPLRMRWTHVLCARANEPGVSVLFEDVGRPAGNTADGKDRRVEVDWNAQRVVRRRGIEIDIRVQLLFALDQRFNPLRHVVPRRYARPFAEIS